MSTSLTGPYITWISNTNDNTNNCDAIYDQTNQKTILNCNTNTLPYTVGIIISTTLTTTNHHHFTIEYNISQNITNNDICGIYYSLNNNKQWKIINTQSNLIANQIYNIIVDNFEDISEQNKVYIKIEFESNNIQNSCNLYYIKLFGYQITVGPTLNPIQMNTNAPTNIPTNMPSTNIPTQIPSNYPTLNTVEPSLIPTKYPTNIPTNIPIIGSNNPTLNTNNSTLFPTKYPSNIPTNLPTNNPVINMTDNPTVMTLNPTKIPTILPTMIPTMLPTTDVPTLNPTNIPSVVPSNGPTILPTNIPTLVTEIPTLIPSELPTMLTHTPTIITTNNVNNNNNNNGILAMLGLENMPKETLYTMIIGVGILIVCCTCLCLAFVCTKMNSIKNQMSTMKSSNPSNHISFTPSINKHTEGRQSFSNVIPINTDDHMPMETNGHISQLIANEMMNNNENNNKNDDNWMLGESNNNDIDNNTLNIVSSMSPKEFMQFMKPKNNNNHSNTNSINFPQNFNILSPNSNIPPPPNMPPVFFGKQSTQSRLSIELQNTQMQVLEMQKMLNSLQQSMSPKIQHNYTQTSTTQITKQSNQHSSTETSDDDEDEDDEDDDDDGEPTLISKMDENESNKHMNGGTMILHTKGLSNMLKVDDQNIDVRSLDLDSNGIDNESDDVKMETIDNNDMINDKNNDEEEDSGF